MQSEAAAAVCENAGLSATATAASLISALRAEQEHPELLYMAKCSPCTEQYTHHSTHHSTAQWSALCGTAPAEPQKPRGENTYNYCNAHTGLLSAGSRRGARAVYHHDHHHIHTHTHFLMHHNCVNYWPPGCRLFCCLCCGAGTTKCQPTHPL